MEQVTNVVLSVFMVLVTCLITWITRKITNFIDNKIKDAKVKTLLNDA